MSGSREPWIISRSIYTGPRHRRLGPIFMGCLALPYIPFLELAYLPIEAVMAFLFQMRCTPCSYRCGRREDPTPVRFVHAIPRHQIRVCSEKKEGRDSRRPLSCLVFRREDHIVIGEVISIRAELWAADGRLKGEIISQTG